MLSMKHIIFKTRTNDNTPKSLVPDSKFKTGKKFELILQCLLSLYRFIESMYNS